ncbi:efflux transporter outer membrane subunit [Labilibacter sediminis]|nr:efflux transporter outer membrane subunit [Labilibacter sediminis]
MKIRSLILAFVATVLCVSSCKVGKKYQSPDIDIPENISHFKENDSLTIADLEWYELFNDTLLNSYIRLALKNNQNVKIAAARVRESMALKRISEAPLMPSMDLFAESNREDVDGETIDTEHILRLELSWELDLWGNIRWGREASIADYFKTLEAQRAIKMSLISNVAQTYFELIAVKRELQIVQETGRARQEGVNIAELRFKGGLTSETSLRQAEVEYAKTMSLIPGLERYIVLNRNKLAKLMGQMPQNVIESQSLYYQQKIHSLPLGMPSDILKRRPDIKQAEQSLIMANALVGEAFTDLFPRVTLTAKYGEENETFEDLLKSPYNYFAASILTPVFSAGAKRARLKAKREALEQAFYEYEQVVINAFHETDNAIVSFYKAKEVRQQRDALENSARNYLELANIQYINGAIGYIDVLDAQRFLFDAEVSLNDAVLDELLSYVYLYKTLGGGWNS